MKKIFFIAILLVLLAAPAFAVTLAWDNDPGWVAQGVVGIRIYWDDDITGVTKYADIPRPNNMATIADSNFTHGVAYSFWATAYNTSKESGPSNVVTATYNWNNTWGAPDPNGAPTPNLPVLRLSATAGGYVVPSSAIKTAP
jgi:hypothetical protein